MPRKRSNLKIVEKLLEEGITDKRLLVMESEFASLLKLLRREANILSPVIRNAWDTWDLNILVKNNPYKATGAHISIIGHITKEELLRHLDDTEAGNGFGNRFLWVFARRSKLLPKGGQLPQAALSPLVNRLKDAVKFARTVGEIKFDEEADHIWCEGYEELSEGKPALLGAMTARAEAQVIRLACIYALLDQSSVIGKEHLKAALAVWDYCERSCQYIFGNTLGDPLADELLRVLRAKPEGMTRTEITNHFKRHKSSSELGKALCSLETSGLAKQKKRETGGRSAELWFALEHAKEEKEAK